jgi:hypothetical protein
MSILRQVKKKIKNLGGYSKKGIQTHHEQQAKAQRSRPEWRPFAQSDGKCYQPRKQKYGHNNPCRDT